MKRQQYRGCFRQDIELTETCKIVTAVKIEVQKQIESGNLLQASLYHYRNMCFLYLECLNEELKPNDFLQNMEPYMEMWPEKDGKTAWVPMYPVYYHSIPKSEWEWEVERRGKQRIGRIAFLYPEQVTSYVRWHQEIVEEGLFEGDKYQFISLHENVLFSYFEEPKTMVNLLEKKEPSKVIEQWMQKKPETHFDRTETGNSNFLIIPSLFSIGRSDLS